jgi:hypothetical protein
MLQVLVFIVLCMAMVALFDGFILGIDIITLFFKGVITLVVGGLGVLLGIGLVLVGLFHIISGG